MAMNSVTKNEKLPFGIPGGRVAKVAYVDEDRNYVDTLVASAIQSTIEMIDFGTGMDETLVRLAADNLRLARERMEAEKTRIRFTSYTGDAAQS